ncbi:MAG: ribosome small subunit-dependent GTPase A [Myxococcota bacterium]
MYDEDDWELRSRDRQRLSRRSKKQRGKPKPRRESAASDGATRAQGVVIEVNARSASVVLSDGSTVLANRPGRLQSRGGGLVVGDEVTVATGDHASVIERVGRRRTLLSRQQPGPRPIEQPIVANVDAIGIVSTASDPPFRPRLVDRYLVAIERSGAAPVVVVNKLDEAPPERRAELDALLAPYEGLGLAVHRVSATTGEGLPELLEQLAGRRVALVGHSGVGKSSLVAAMGASAIAGGLTEHGRGRHTTSGSTLHRLPEGTEIIDTPGVRQFGLFDLTRRQLLAAFPEFAAFAADCAWASCTHDDEPDCAVRIAAEDGRLCAARYDSYRRLLPDAR